MKFQLYFSGKNKKNITSRSSAELAPESGKCDTVPKAEKLTIL